MSRKIMRPEWLDGSFRLEEAGMTEKCSRCAGSGKEPGEYEEWPVKQMALSGDWYTRDPVSQTAHFLPLVATLGRFAGFIYEYGGGRSISVLPVAVESPDGLWMISSNSAEAGIIRPVAVRMRRV